MQLMPPSARRRHAHLIATTTRLIATTTTAAATMYESIAEAGGEPTLVSTRDLQLAAAAAPTLLDYARAWDREAWPEQTAGEAIDAEHSAARRAIVAAAEDAIASAAPEQAWHEIDLPPEVLDGASADQHMPVLAAVALLDAEIDPQSVCDIADQADISPTELIGEAIDIAASSACLTLLSVHTLAADDPSAAAEAAVAATTSLATVVKLASLDV